MPKTKKKRVVPGVARFPPVSKAEMGARVRVARVGLGVNLNQWRRVTGRSSRTIQDAERGLHYIGAENLLWLARQGVDINWVLTGEPCAKPGAVNRESLHSLGMVRVLTDDGATASRAAPFYLGNDAGELPNGLADPSGVYAFRQADDSMSPTLYRDDWAICVPYSDTAAPGNGLYVVQLDRVRAIRRLRAMPKSSLEVRQDNRHAGEPFLVHYAPGERRKNDVVLVARVLGPLGALP